MPQGRSSKQSLAGWLSELSFKARWEEGVPPTFLGVSVAAATCGAGGMESAGLGPAPHPDLTPSVPSKCPVMFLSHTLTPY